MPLRSITTLENMKAIYEMDNLTLRYGPNNANKIYQHLRYLMLGLLLFANCKIFDGKIFSQEFQDSWLTTQTNILSWNYKIIYISFNLLGLTLLFHGSIIVT